MRRQRWQAWLWALMLGMGTVRSAGAEVVADFFRAVQIDDVRTVKKLLDGALDPNVHNPVDGETGLILAMREGADRVAAVLLAQPGIALEASAPNGNTALMMAAFRHNEKAVLALLAKGAQVNRSGWTALHYAAAAGDDTIAGILLEHGARIDAAAPGDLTPLMIAAREGHESTARLLLARGAATRLESGEALTAEQIAERADKPHIAAAIRAVSAARPAAVPAR